MALSDIIDAISGPTIKQGDLPPNVSASQGTASAFVQGLKEETQQAATIIVERSKDILKEPLEMLSTAAAKAIPAAIAASASLQYTGGQGSFANFLVPVTLRVRYFPVDGDRNAYMGRPLNKTRQLSGLSGFCKCANVKLELPSASSHPAATKTELELVIKFLETGVLLE